MSTLFPTTPSDGSATLSDHPALTRKTGERSANGHSARDGFPYMNHGPVGSGGYQDCRFGLHYFPDTLHYREADLQTWLPELKRMGAGWLVLRSDLDRAIPERFLSGLKAARIEPIIQFQLPLGELPDLKEIGTLLEVYAHWGARYIILFDRPNARASWPASSWVQQDLVECFLDRFLPVAGLALQLGLIPVFPPLEPGGSYWDTAFLRSALQALQRRKQTALLQNLVLSAYAWTGGRSLDWGAGGPERWPQARPYLTSTTSEDQQGFRIFDWYEAIARSVLQRSCPIILLDAGMPADPRLSSDQEAGSCDDETCMRILRLLAGEKVVDPQAVENELEPVSSQVIACNFWLLSAEPTSPFASQAWFQADGTKHPVVDKIQVWQQERPHQETLLAAGASMPSDRPIQHYLLLPGFEWGVSDWYLEVIRPYVKKHLPTIGFSANEAEQAAYVTIVGNLSSYPEDLLSRLEKAGCWVEQISGDGTNIATQLAER